MVGVRTERTGLVLPRGGTTGWKAMRCTGCVRCGGDMDRRPPGPDRLRISLKGALCETDLRAGRY